MTDPREPRSLEEIVDFCIDEIAAGRLGIEQALGRWPEHRAELGALLGAAFAISELPEVPEHAPDAERRADFLSAIRTTPQDSPQRSRRWLALPSLGSLFGTSLPRLATIAAPAAAIAVIAIVLTLGGGASPASASTLTVFAGAVEREQDGGWQALDDGATLEQGDHLRTTEAGHALLTFADGSTAALDPATELVIEQATVNGERSIALHQLAGRIWNDVAPGATPASYVVRTADAVIEAHGTTFETLVTGDQTAVVTAEGTVEVVHGDAHTSVTAGQVLQIARQQLVDAVQTHAAASAPVTLTVFGPFVASLQSASGAATGALPSGVTFQQIPGVTTSDPGDGRQQLLFFDIEPGRYEFTLRRIGAARDAAGRLTLDAPNGSRSIELPATVQSITIRVEIAVQDGRVTIHLIDTEARPTSTDHAPERIVDSPRITDAEPVATRRDSLTGAAPTAVSPTDATRVTDDPTRTPPPNDDSSGAPTDLESRLRQVLNSAEHERRVLLRTYLEDLGRDDAPWLKLRELLLADDALRHAFVETVASFESDALKAAIHERLHLDSDASSGDTSLSTATPAASLDSATR